jgi:hypothetical protein
MPTKKYLVEVVSVEAFDGETGKLIYSEKYPVLTDEKGKKYIEMFSTSKGKYKHYLDKQDLQELGY